MSHSRLQGGHRHTTFKTRINKETDSCTKFYDVSEGTGTLEKSLSAPVLPELVEDNLQNLLPFLHPTNPFQLPRLQRIGETQLDKILHDFKKGALFFIGHAGSGKTTLLKHIAQLVLADELLSLTGIELVLYIKCQEICPNTEITEQELFFRGVLGSDAREAIQFINLHQSECLFLVDSAETCLDPEVLRYDTSSSKGDKKRKPGELLANLISGRRFPDTRVIATSRFRLNIQGTRFVLLRGLSPTSMMKIMTDYLGNIRRGTEEFKNLSVKYPHLASLCSTPVFLVYVLMAQMSDGKTFSLTTISQVMISLLENFSRSKHLRQRKKNIVTLLSVLKSISYEGLENAKFLFSKQDFKRRNFPLQEAGDFTTQHWLLKKLLRGGEFVHFNHVSLQEAFAAIYVAEMEERSFRDHAERRLLPAVGIAQNSLSRRLVFGILLDSCIEKGSSPLLSNLQNLKRNRGILLELLQKFFAAHQDLDDIEFICALHEANDGILDVVNSTVKSIKIVSQILFPSDYYMIGSVTTKFKHLSELSLDASDVTSYHLEILCGAMESCVQVDTLSLSNNPNLGPNGLNTAGKLVSTCQTKHVKLDGSIVFPADIESFNEGVGDHKMEKLDLSWNKKMKKVIDMTPEKEDCEVVYHFKANIESVQDLDVPEVRRKQILEGLQTENFEQFWKIDGEWKRAPRDLCRRVINILPKVTEKLKLHGWRFNGDEIATMDERVRELKRKSLRLSLGKDMILPGNSRNRSASTDSKAVETVRCEVHGDAIKVSWDKVMEAECYLIQIFRGGEKVFERKISGLSHTEKSINPSTSYQFLVRPQYRDGRESSDCKSNVVITDPKPPVDVEAKETETGICLSWKPAKNDNIERYVVKTTRLKDVSVRTELFGKTSYLYENLIPGCKYYFEVEPYNAFGRRGKAALSSVVEFTGKRKQPMSNAHCEIAKKQTISSPALASKSKKQETPCDFFSGIHAEEELKRWCHERRHSRQTVSFKEIQIAHAPLDDGKIQLLTNIFSLSSTVGELELRDCGLKGKILTRLNDGVSNLNCKFEQITVGAQSNIGELMGVLCNSVLCFGARMLNLSDNDIRPDMIRSLLDLLSKTEDKSLQGLDVSFNRNIANWEDVGKILRKKSLPVLKAMGCDIRAQDLKGLERGNADWKIKHLDLSYNSELTTECFEIMPLLLANDAKLLVLSECGLTKYEINAFDDNASSEQTVETIDVSYNEDLGLEGMSAVGRLVVHRKARKLSVAGCDLDGGLLKSLSGRLENHALMDVDMSDNPAIGDEAERVGNFVRKQRVENLDVSECGLSAGQIKSFQTGLKDTQISVLNVSDSTRNADISFITSICHLIPSVKTELVAVFPNIDKGCLQMMQETLDSMEGNGPQVTYATATESTMLANGIKFTVGTEKKILRKRT